jgi:Flp pilus assembly protein TadD
MKKFSHLLTLTTALALSACNSIAGKQWLDPDTTFATIPQPTLKGINDTQEEIAKEAAANGDFVRAGQFYAQLVGSNKGTPEQVLRYKIGLAEAHRRLGNHEAAIAMYDELYGQNRSNLDIAEGRALTLMGSGKVTEAGQAFSQVLERDKRRWRTLNALGILFTSKNLVPEAIAYYTEALNVSPDNSAVLNNVGLSYAIDRQFERALAALEQGVRVSKAPAQRKQIDLNLALVAGVSGNFDAARDIASKYYEGAALDNNLGLYAHLAKDDALAKSYLNSALSQSPTYYERAWENLEIVNGAGGASRWDAPVKPATALPKVDVLKSHAKSKARKKSSTATDASVTAKEPLPPEVAFDEEVPMGK